MAMPGINGINLIRRLRAEHPVLPILVLSMHNECQVVSRALRAGATGYVTKNSDPDILLIAIRKLAEGGRFIDPEVVDAVVFGGYLKDPSPHEALSDREFEVLQLLVAGNSVNEIAKRLSLSPKTISTHKLRSMEKLGLENNCQLYLHAIRYQLIPE
jgi:DNA-binding NarL/FixJ family response regulator